VKKCSKAKSKKAVNVTWKFVMTVRSFQKNIRIFLKGGDYDGIYSQLSVWAHTRYMFKISQHQFVEICEEVSDCCELADCEFSLRVLLFAASELADANWRAYVKYKIGIHYFKRHQLNRALIYFESALVGDTYIPSLLGISTCYFLMRAGGLALRVALKVFYECEELGETDYSLLALAGLERLIHEDDIDDAGVNEDTEQEELYATKVEKKLKRPLSAVTEKVNQSVNCPRPRSATISKGKPEQKPLSVTKTRPNSSKDRKHRREILDPNDVIFEYDDEPN
jgi:hypothetical protein